VNILMCGIIGNVKVKSFALCNYAPCHGDVQCGKIHFHTLLTLAAYEGEWSASRSGHFVLRKQSPVRVGGRQSWPGPDGE
jgi:hypothetical protein